MSFTSWLKRFLGLTRRRDIARLAREGDDEAASAALHEDVDVRGGPLKPGHRRQAIRDPRLLPKRWNLTRRTGSKQRTLVMSKQVADRLFGATFRTRNRSLRDLATDRDQLARYGLPLWESEADLAAALGISERELQFFAIHREREKQSHYIRFAIPKRAGGERIIMAPKRRLKALQRKLLGLLVSKLPVSDRAHGFRPGRSIVSGARAHADKPLVVRFDLKDFFPSVTMARVRGLLIAYGYSYPVATSLAVLMTEAERQPVSADGVLYHVPVGQRHCVQGAPTSPGLCNAMLLRLDRRLAGFAVKHGLEYTRYADDLSFSGELGRDRRDWLASTVRQIVTSEGFQLNPAKTKFMGRGTRQTVTGVTVNEGPGLSRDERRRLRAALHRHKQAHGPDAPLPPKLQGKLAYLRMINPDQCARIEARPMDDNPEGKIP